MTEILKLSQMKILKDLKEDKEAEKEGNICWFQNKQNIENKCGEE